MNFMPEEEQIKPEINIVTLIDVVLLLLIFFMITTQFTFQSGIEVKLPQSKASPMEPAPELIVTITRQQELYLNKQKTTLAEFPEQLKIITTGRNKKEQLLIIRADKEVAHGKVVEIMDLAQGVGIQRLGIATEKKD